MLEKLARWYLIRKMRKLKINNIELAITSDGWTYHKRDKAKEKAINKLIALIK